MANTILIKRGLKKDIDSLTLLSGELGIALDTQELYVGDQNGNKQIIKAAANGTVDTAGKLAIARAIGLKGDATGSASFDGSKDIEIALTLANSGVTAGTYPKVTVDAKGRVTKGEALTISDLPTITITDVQNLETSLNAKVNKTDYNAAIETINSNITALDEAIDTKADAANVYDKDTVDAKIDAKDSLPAQAGQSGKFLTTNGTTASWGTVDLSSKADKTSVYTKEEVDTAVNAKATKATSLAGYGISDAYTKTEVNTELGKKADSATTLSGYGITDAYTQAQVNTELDKKADKATSLSGYGIADAYTKAEVDGMVAGTFHFRGEVDSYSALPTNAKEGDVWQVGDKEYAWDGDSWVELGFNIDLSAYAKTADVNTNLATKADKSDTYTKTQVDTAVNAKADKATTLAGYGITDAKINGQTITLGTNNITVPTNTNQLTNGAGYITGITSKNVTDALGFTPYNATNPSGYQTAAQVQTAIANKADKSTTLAGYGISNAYTKTEVDTKVTTLQTDINTRLNASSTIDGGTF